jgi:hypothetical protein
MNLTLERRLHLDEVVVKRVFEDENIDLMKRKAQLIDMCMDEIV